MNSRTYLTLSILWLMAGCTKGQAVPTAQGIQQPGMAETAISITEVAPSSIAETLPPTEILTGGPGTFDLADPAAGLDKLDRYHATLRLSFQGTKQGQPYLEEKTYDLVVDRNLPAWLLTQMTQDPATRTFSGFLGELRYGQAAPDQPCWSALASEGQAQLFEPAHLLPHLLGGEEAGQEAVNGVAASAYSFDQRALGAGEGAEAIGKVWIAQEGGWVLRYELSLKSNRVFGEGISGEQRWAYELGELGAAEARLPESCPPALSDLPLPPDAANVKRWPGFLEFTTKMNTDDLGAFYEEQLTAQEWVRQDDPLETPGGVRRVYAKPVGEKSRCWSSPASLRKRDGW